MLSAYLDLQLKNTTPEKGDEKPRLLYTAQGDFVNKVLLTLQNNTNYKKPKDDESSQGTDDCTSKNGDNEPLCVPKDAIFVFQFEASNLVTVDKMKLKSSGDKAFKLSKGNRDGEFHLVVDKAFPWANKSTLEFTLELPCRPKQASSIGSVQLTGVQGFKALEVFFEDELEEDFKSNSRSLSVLETAAKNKVPLKLDCSYVQNRTGGDENVVFITPKGEIEIHNRITFELTNHSSDAVQRGSITVALAGPSNFDPSYPRPIRAWELASPEDMADCRLLLPEGIYQENEIKAAAKGEYLHSQGLMVWKIPAKQDGKLLETGGDQRLRIVIDHIVSQNSQPGTVDFMVLLTGMKNYEDTVRYLTISKQEPEPGIVRFDCKNQNNTVKPNEAVRLSWACINVDDVWLSYTLKDGTVVIIPKPTNNPQATDKSLPLFNKDFELKREDYPELPTGDDLQLFLYANEEKGNRERPDADYKKESLVTFLEGKPEITVRQCKFIDDNKQLQFDYEFDKDSDIMIISSRLLKGNEHVQHLNKPKDPPVTVDIIEDKISSWNDQIFTFSVENDRGGAEVKRTALFQPVIDRFDIEYTSDNKLKITYETRFLKDNGKVWISFQYNGEWKRINWTDGSKGTDPKQTYQGTYEIDVMNHPVLKPIWEQNKEKASIQVCITLSTQNLDGERESATDFKWYDEKEVGGWLTLYRTPELEIATNPFFKDYPDFVRTINSASFLIQDGIFQILQFFLKTDENEKTLFLRENEKALVVFDPKDETQRELLCEDTDYSFYVSKQANRWPLSMRVQGNRLVPSLLHKRGQYLSIPESLSQKADFSLAIVVRNHIPETENTLYFKELKKEKYGGDGGEYHDLKNDSISIIKISADENMVRALRVNDKWYGHEDDGTLTSPLKFSDEGYIKSIEMYTAKDGSHVIITYLKITSSNGSSIEGGNKTFGEDIKPYTLNGIIRLTGLQSGSALDAIEVSYFEGIYM